ncbi:MAG: c-type cytochrome [Balneolaceae bacterium]|nr:c-type cytochrome [Balneolaceae bacterium]
MKRPTRAIPFFTLIAVITVTVANCRMDRPRYMTDDRQRQIESVYDSLQTSYNALMQQYEDSPDSLQGQLKSLYARMQEMHRQMDANHRQMISMNMGRHENMMGRDMDMGMHRQGRMTGEWYRQMMSMHDRMATMHRQMGNGSMAEMNRALADGFQKMQQMMPGGAEQDEESFAEDVDPASLDGQSLYSQNCASCHGSNGQGISGAFPPLVDSKFITGDPSVPIRILLNGLSGEIEVRGRTYSGSMPSFRARLSAAEMASILNYLRSASSEDLPEITREEVIGTGKTYSGRTEPWSANALLNP